MKSKAKRKKSKKSLAETSLSPNITTKMKSKAMKRKHSVGKFRKNINNDTIKKVIPSDRDAVIKKQDKIVSTYKKKKMFSDKQKGDLENISLGEHKKKKNKKNRKTPVNDSEEKIGPPTNEPKSKLAQHDPQSNKLTPILKTAGAIQKPKNIKKEKIKQKFKCLLDTEMKRTSIKSSGTALRTRMLDRLKAAQFRYLNEKLYLSEGKDAKEMFKTDPTSFKIYHDGFRQQVKKWPINPLDVIIKQIGKMPKETKVADMGCGEGELAKQVQQRVRSFDLVSSAAGVEECDMAHTPLLSGEMDVVVYCLALMGTNLKEYLIEANRILKVGGTMKIAEVESRFSDVNEFIKCVECYGFKLTRVDDSRKVFYFLDFKKLRDLGSKRNKLPHITLEPCLYKKR